MPDRSGESRHSARWTQTDITELREQVKSGTSISDLASVLDRSAADVTQMMERLRLTVLEQMRASSPFT